jgi:hypothetical protein
MDAESKTAIVDQIVRGEAIVSAASFVGDAMTLTCGGENAQPGLAA